MLIYTYFAGNNLQMCFTVKNMPSCWIYFLSFELYLFIYLFIPKLWKIDGQILPYETWNGATEKGPTYKDISVQHIPQRWIAVWWYGRAEQWEGFQENGLWCGIVRMHCGGRGNQHAWAHLNLHKLSRNDSDKCYTLFYNMFNA